jgi:hypothetical protein
MPRSPQKTGLMVIAGDQNVNASSSIVCVVKADVDVLVAVEGMSGRAFLRKSTSLERENGSGTIGGVCWNRKLAQNATMITPRVLAAA